MKSAISGDITYMTDINEYNLHSLRETTLAVLDYLNREIGTQIRDFNVDIVIAKDFKKVVNHYLEDDDLIGVNACLINRHIIKNRDVKKKDVIIVDWNSCSHLDTSTFASAILLHELNHHLDYRYIEKVNADYQVNIFSNSYHTNDNELEKAIEVLFMARSEMRSFYYEEKHLALNNLCTPSIDQVTIMTEEHRCISFILPRLLGKIKYWEETVNVHRLMEANSYIQTGSPLVRNWEQYIRRSFSYCDFEEVCIYFTNVIK